MREKSQLNNAGPQPITASATGFLDFRDGAMHVIPFLTTPSCGDPLIAAQPIAASLGQGE
jgi:hypothetical protein